MFLRKATGSLCGRVFCNGADETWGERIQVQAFIMKHGQNTGRDEQQQTGMAQARQKNNPKWACVRRQNR